MEQFKSLLKKYQTKTDKVLAEIMDIEGVKAKKIIESMNYTIFSGGKRLRPILTVMVAKLLAGDIASAYKIGASLELIHCYSLIHDDLPSMDDDDYRRGKLSNHKIYGEAIAILAGDGLLTYAFNILSKLNLESEKIVKIIALISESAGFLGMVGGQVLDLEAENKKIDLAGLKDIHQAKTGALFRAAILAGAYCAEHSQAEFEALDKYAQYLGLTFQIVDDILDVTGSKEELGKEVGRDESLAKATYPSLMGLEQAKKEAFKQAQLAKEALNIFSEDQVKSLINLVDFIITRRY